MRYLNLKYILLVIVTGMALVSCNDFLDEKPYSDLTNENLGLGSDSEDSIKYTTATQAEQLITGAYSDFASELWQLDMYIMNEGQSDNAYAGENKDQTRQLDELRINPTNGNVARDWKYLYQHISKANEIITWVPKIQDPLLTDARKKEIVAEAMFMRAICYFNLVRIFGSVPLITQDIPEINVDNIDEIYPLLYPEQSSVDVIYNQIIQDLDYAQKNVTDFVVRPVKCFKF